MIDEICSMWQEFPINTIYQTSVSSNINIELNDSIFVYNKSRTINPIGVKLDLNLRYFTVFQVLTLGLKTPCGYIIKPNIPEGFNFRYTPLSLSISKADLTIDNVSNSSRHTLLKDKIEVLQFSCPTEMITTIGTSLGVELSS